MFENTPSHLKLLNSHLKENKVWAKLATAVTEVINEVIDEPRWALSRARQSKVVERGDFINTPSGKGQVTLVRRTLSNEDLEANTYDYTDIVEVQLPDGSISSLPVNAGHDRSTLIDQSKFLGFDYFSDVLQDDDYERIVDFIGGYWANSGGDNFIDMVSFIKRQRYEIEQLWTPLKDDPGEPTWTSLVDSKEPLTEVDEYDGLNNLGQSQQVIFQAPGFKLGEGVDVADPAYVYRTSHVQLSWDLIDYPTVDFLGVVSLFYLLAPIHLVLHRFVGSIYAEEILRAGLAQQIHTIPQGSASWDNAAQYNTSLSTATQINTIPQGAVKVPFPLP